MNLCLHPHFPPFDIIMNIIIFEEGIKGREYQCDINIIYYNDNFMFFLYGMKLIEKDLICFKICI